MIGVRYGVDYGLIVKETVLGWWEDKAPRLGAALAFYTVLSLAPMLVLITPLAGLIFGQDAARRGIVEQFRGLVGPEGAQAIGAVISTNSFQSPDPWATALGIAVLAFGATGVFAELQDALNTVWEVAPAPGRAAFWSFVRQRFLSFTMVMGICFLLLVSLVIGAALSALRNLVSERLQTTADVWSIAHSGASLIVITLLFAMMFKILPDATVPWRDVWTGSILTAGLFTVGKFLIGLYLGHAAVVRAYGGAASLVVLLLWVYYSSQILILGAEFTHAYAKVRGSRVMPTDIAVTITNDARAQQGIPKIADVQAAKAADERHFS